MVQYVYKENPTFQSFHDCVGNVHKNIYKC